MQTAPKLTRQHFEFFADKLGEKLGWPTALHDIADVLAETNERFDRDKFLRRAIDTWEQTHELPDLEDEIPY